MGRGFTAGDRQKIDLMLSTMNKLATCFNSLKEHVVKTHELLVEQTKQINKLRCEGNLRLYQNDALEQYGRRESIRIHNVTQDMGDDAVEIVLDMATEIEALAGAEGEDASLSIGLTRNDIHRCHFLGKENQATKKIICRFNSSAWHKRTKILMNKRHVNQVREGRFGKMFVSEDLTSMRSGMMYYLKNNHGDKYHKFHTRNGAIKFKDKSDNTNTGKWKTVHDPDGLHKLLGDDLDVDELNKGLKARHQVLKQLPLPEMPLLDYDTIEQVNYDTDE